MIYQKYEMFFIYVEAQRDRPFWRHPGNYDMRLRPDIVVRKNVGADSEEVVVIDTKWKYRSDTSVGDVRQMYAYGRYLGDSDTFLLYPDWLEGQRGRSARLLNLPPDIAGCLMGRVSD